MSSSIFRVFGILVLALLVFAVLSQLSGLNDPVTKTATTFLTAAQNGDAETVKKLVDPAMADVVAAGSKLTGVHFKAQNVFQGAFSSQPEVMWQALDLSSVSVPRDTQPTISDDMSSVALARNGDNGGHVLMHRDKTGAWKIFYITKPENEGSGK